MQQQRYSAKFTAVIFTTIGFVLLGLCNKVLAKDYNLNISLEAGAVWQERNDVQIPGDTGTRFSLAELGTYTGSDLRKWNLYGVGPT